MNGWDKDIRQILITETELDRATFRIASEIDRDYAGSEHLVLLCVLKGSIVFTSELMRKLTIPSEVDFMKVSSYGSGTVSSGNVHIILDILRQDLPQCDILIIEDIIDSGRTLSYLADYLRLKGARSVRTCTLLDKPSRRTVPFQPDYTGFAIPDEFVVGYGLDFDERYRTLPYIGVLKPEVYESQ